LAQAILAQGKCSALMPDRTVSDSLRPMADLKGMRHKIHILVLLSALPGFVCGHANSTAILDDCAVKATIFGDCATEAFSVLQVLQVRSDTGSSSSPSRAAVQEVPLPLIPYPALVNLSSKAVQEVRLPLIPYPALVRLSLKAPPFRLEGGIEVKVGKGIPENNLAMATLRKALQGQREVRTDGAGGAAHVGGIVHLEVVLDKAKSPESYVLQIREHEIELMAPALAGLFYGVQTLRQLVQTGAHRKELPQVLIQDSPRFEWRGLLLDVSRHFFGAEEVKLFLDTMATFKLNRFHWHLTDDQGWRLPVDGYPKLTEVGSEGFGGRQSYTEEQIRDVVAYAKERHIEVVPEVELPGHVVAALAAYPQLGNRDVEGWQAPAGPLDHFGVSDYTLSPSNATLAFMEVFSTIGRLFESPWVHIGGDEASTKEWSASTAARDFLATEASSGGQVQSFFSRHAGEMVERTNKTVISWDESLHMPGLPESSVIMAWRSEDEVRKALEAGKKVINCDQTTYYFDHYQGPHDSEPKAFCCLTTLQQVYDRDPMPLGLNEEQKKLVLGGQGQLWSEYLPDWKQVEYMAFPRSLALAERLWTAPARIWGFDEFKARLSERLKDLDERDVKYKSPSNAL